jgi:hypothetical protein
LLDLEKLREQMQTETLTQVDQEKMAVGAAYDERAKQIIKLANLGRLNAQKKSRRKKRTQSPRWPRSIALMPGNNRAETVRASRRWIMSRKLRQPRSRCAMRSSNNNCGAKIW